MTDFRILRTDLGFDPVTLARTHLLIGRALANDLVINDASIAFSHAGICWRDGACWLSNFAERGTQLNGSPITHAQVLPDDVIQLGGYCLRLTAKAAALQLEIIAQPLQDTHPSNSTTETTRQAPAPEQQHALAADWHQQRQQAGLNESSTDNWLPVAFRDSDVTAPLRRTLRVSWLRLALMVLAVACVAALAFPRAFAPDEVSKVHKAKPLIQMPAHAAQPLQNECMSCHNVMHSMQTNCANCHTTANFQPTVAVKHERLNMLCIACHAEHRGAQHQPAQVINAICLNCHQQNARPLHGNAVAYPVNARGVWGWDGLSQTQWQRRQLPGVTANYTLREQFHMLHGEGRSAGRTRCTDCHLSGTEPATVKNNVRESCAQCHALRPAFAAELVRLARREPLKSGMTDCVACHVQHGSEKDALASIRKR